MSSVERILDRFEWLEGDPTVEARAAAAGLADALGVLASEVPVARGFVDTDTAMFAIEGEELIVSQRRLLRTMVRRFPLGPRARLERTDEWKRIVIELETRAGALTLRLVPEPACEAFVRSLLPKTQDQITFENYLGRRRPKGNL